MTTKDELFNQYVLVKTEFDKCQKEMTELKSALKPYFTARGETQTNAFGVTLRMDGRKQLNQEKFLQRVGAKVFATVSKRVTVATLIKAAVLKGRITQHDVDECMEDTETWFKII